MQPTLTQCWAEGECKDTGPKGQRTNNNVTAKILLIKKENKTKQDTF